MKIEVAKLTDFTSNHCYEAEVAIQQWICNEYNFTPGIVTEGYASEFDFIINLTPIELKISTKGTSTSWMELSRDDYSPSGLSATKSDVHVFLNANGNIGKLRLIKTSDLIAYYFHKTTGRKTTNTRGDKKGSYLAPLNFLNQKDLMIGECSYSNGVFNADTMSGNTYAGQYINNYIK